MLRTAAIAFLAANLLHTADHFRQGTGDLTTEILVAGTGLTIGAVVVLLLVLREHPRAPLFAAVIGVFGALGIVAAHIAPHWSALSDSYVEGGQDALSWVVVLIEISTAAVLGYAGLRDLRASAPTPRQA
jgi:hypothetical protein